MNEQPNFDRKEYGNFLKSMERKRATHERKREHRAEVATKYKWLTENLLAEQLQLMIHDHQWVPRKNLTAFGGRQHVDVVGTPNTGHYLVFIEIEGGQTRPIPNVAKIWRHMEAGQVVRPVLLIQVFSPFYAKSEGVHNTRMQESIFVAEQADKYAGNMTYRWLSPDTFPENRDELNSLIRIIRAIIDDYKRAAG